MEKSVRFDKSMTAVVKGLMLLWTIATPCSRA